MNRRSGRSSGCTCRSRASRPTRSLMDMALDRLRTDRFDLVVLDVMLPGVDGVTLCRALRSGGPNQRAGVLMLTARDTELEKVLGLESGADDYLTKPFGVREFMARVT